MDDNPQRPADRERGRIMDRKIEASGRSTFSSSLSQSRPSPRPSPGPGRNFSGNSSVRAIVDWLESTSSDGTPETNKPDRSSNDSTREQETTPTIPPRPATRYGPSSIPSSQPRRPTGHGASSIHSTVYSSPTPAPLVQSTEDYSLTLLKFKSYFNNRPLARCLDDIAGAETVSNAMHFDRRPEEEGVEKKKKHMVLEFKEERRKENVTPMAGKVIETKNKEERPSHKKSESLQKLDEVMQELSDLSSPIPTPLLPVEENPPQRLPPRTPVETKKYWDGVRSYLWISDSELSSSDSNTSAGSDIESEAASLPPLDRAGFGTIPSDPSLLDQVDTQLNSLHLSPAGMQPSTNSPRPFQWPTAANTPRPSRRRTASNTPQISRRPTASNTPQPSPVHHSHKSSKSKYPAGRKHQGSGASQSTSQSTSHSTGGRSGGSSVRKLTAEEKMSEIDEFLDHRSPTIAVLQAMKLLEGEDAASDEAAV